MRLRTVNRVCLFAVSSTVVTSLMAGCMQHSEPASSIPPQHPGSLANNGYTFQPASDTVASTQAVTQPAGLMPSDATTQSAVATAPTPPIALATQPVANPPAALPTPAAPAAASLGATATPSPSTQTSATQPATEPVVQVPPTDDAPPATDSKVIESDQILADRLASIAELEFASKVTDQDAWPWIWKHQIALFAAAGHLYPTAPRFARLKADAYAQLRDEKGEAAALGDAINAKNSVESVDEFAWNRRLDLILNSDRFQIAKDKVDFLSYVIGEVVVPANVRSHAAFRKAQTLLDRGEEDAANKSLEEGLRLCPSNLECLILRYNLLSPTASHFERCNQLMDLLRANPLQSQYSALMADLVADSGLFQESLPWFNLAVNTLHRQGNPGTHTMLNLAAELYIADEKTDAFRVNEALLKLDPTNTQAHFLQLVITRSLGDKDAYTKAMQQAGNALSDRVIDAINDSAPNAPKSTTRPIDDPTPMTLPDLAPTVALLNQSGTPAAKQQFAEAVSDLALLEGYFAQQPDVAGKLVDSLEQIVPKDSPEIARLRGWNLLLTGKNDDAGTAFTSVVTQDPLAELGMIKIMMTDDKKRQQAESLGRRLIQDHPSGLLGAILWEQLHSERVKLIPTTQAVALQTPLAAFPTDLFSFADQPQKFYGLHVQPTPVPSFVGEPILATVTIYNLSEHDLTVGPDGELKPEMLFRLAPDIPQSPVFEAFDTIAGPTVVAAHGRITQIVRLDQTQMLEYMDRESGVACQINGSLTSNQTVDRLGGYPVGFFEKFYRQPSPVNVQNIQIAENNITDGRADQKITSLSLLQMFVQQLRTVKNPPEGMAQQIATMMEVIHHAKTDTLPSVSAWACKCEAELVDETTHETIVRDMAEDPDWRHRQIAVLMLGTVSFAVRNELLTKLVIDPQTSVREDALAVRGIMSLPPATSAPSAAPSSPPATPPGAAAPDAPPVAIPAVPLTPPATSPAKQ